MYHIADIYFFIFGIKVLATIKQYDKISYSHLVPCSLLFVKNNKKLNG